MPPVVALVKGHIFRQVDGAVVDRYVFQYNPTTYKVAHGANWTYTNAVGQFMPIASFESFTKRQLNMTLFLYTAGTIGKRPSDVFEEHEARLKLFVSPGPDFSADNPQFVSPGRAIFVLGNRLMTTAVDRVDFEYTLFDPDGNPVAATVAVSATIISTGKAGDLAVLSRTRSRARLDG